jgi:hypothetical protein
MPAIDADSVTLGLLCSPFHSTCSRADRHAYHYHSHCPGDRVPDREKSAHSNIHTAGQFYATANQAFTSSTAAATAPIGEATAPLPPNAGGGLFTNLARSADKFSLRCQPDTLNFGVSTSDPAVTGVDFYYRIEDRLKISISSWQFGGSMASDGQGNFSIAFPASRVDPDLRSSLAWFDYQFVGISKVGDVIGRSGRISKQVTYTLDCSE